MKRIVAGLATLILSAAAFLVPAIAGAATLNPTAEKPVVWRMGGLYARGVSYGKTYQAFADNVKRMSGGRLVIEVIYDGEGVPAAEVLSAVRSGLIEVANPFQALHAGEFPAGVVELGLPDGPRDFLEIRAMFREGGWLAAIRKAYASIGVYYLSEAPQPGTYLMTKKPIKSLNDLKEMKIRCPGAYGMKLANVGAPRAPRPLPEFSAPRPPGFWGGGAA